MNKYIAFLRGINISGKNKIDMSDLKSEFENAGFTNVSTYLNSGNVSFLSNENNLKNKIEDIQRKINIIYHRSHRHITKIMTELNDLLERMDKSFEGYSY